MPDKDKFKRSRQELDSSAEVDDMSNNEILKALKEMDTRLSSKIDLLESSIDSRLSSKIDTLQSNLLSTINGVKSEFDEKLQAVSASIEKRFQAVDNNFNQLESRCDELMGSSNGNTNNSTDTRLDRLERQSLMNELIVSGVPIEKRRSADSIVAGICDVLQCDLRENDFAAIFRVPSRKGNGQAGDDSRRTTSPPIILRFNYAWAKHNFLDSYYKKKDLSLKDIGFKTARRIYVNESLTALNRQIFTMALQLKKNGRIFRCFTRQGLVYVQEEASSNSFRVTSKLDLDKYRDEPIPESAQHNGMDTQ